MQQWGHDLEIQPVQQFRLFFQRNIVKFDLIRVTIQINIYYPEFKIPILSQNPMYPKNRKECTLLIYFIIVLKSSHSKANKTCF